MGRKISLFICLLLIAAGVIPIIYAMIVFPDPPHVRDWNYVQKKKVAKQLNALFDKNKVTMVFTAHVHGYYSGVWR